MLRKLGSDWNVFRITPLDQADTVHISLTACKNELNTKMAMKLKLQASQLLKRWQGLFNKTGKIYLFNL